jgi:RNA polymerase sigma-70 factor (ECF subfamily)
MFTACHPVLSAEARVALTLRLLGGLTTEEIARAFLVPEPTVAQRIVRAKRTLAKARVPFEPPTAEERAARLPSVLEVIYLTFNEGYSATAGDDWLRPALCEDALRLGRVVAELVPDEPEVHGLVALMELHASRFKARTGRSGEPVLLLDQNRALWDRLLIRRGLAALDRAEQLGGARGPYALQAAIVACHARALIAEATDWARIAALYEALAAVMPSPVVELNRAVAVGMAFVPQAGLAVVDAVTDAPSLRDYPPLPSVRGDLLEKLGRLDDARREFERAAALTKNERERAVLLGRAAACATTASDSRPHIRSRWACRSAAPAHSRSRRSAPWPRPEPLPGRAGSLLAPAARGRPEGEGAASCAPTRVRSYTPTFGQRGSRMHVPHFGLRAWQVRRPCWIRSTWNG